MSSSVPTASGFTVVTHVYPQQSDAAVSAPFSKLNVSPSMGKFLKGEPKAQGIVQMMIGVINIFFGIVNAIYPTSIGVFSGIFFWGGLIYVISGALTVAADKHLNKCLVKGSLGMNIFSTITAGIAIILFSIDLVLVNMFYVNCETNDCWQMENMFQTRSQGITGVLLVFSILEFIISICVSAFACRAVCDCTPEQAVFVQTQQAPINTVTPGYLPSPAVNTHDMTYGSNLLNNSALVNLNRELQPSKQQ